jgi:mitofilin
VLRYLVNFIIISVLGYGIGVYYALTSDNWHDFFTEYIPYAEDVVAYFEEREFRKRLAARPHTEPRLHPQVRSEQITIPQRAGVSVKDVADGSSQAPKGSGAAAAKPAAGTTDASPPHPQTANLQSVERETRPVSPSTTQQLLPKTEAASPKADGDSKSVGNAEPVADQPPPTPAELVDNLSIDHADEPLVQDVVKMLNDIISVINADNAAGKYSGAIDQAKSSLSKVLEDINVLKQREQKAAEDQILKLHGEFDEAAREMLRRTEEEMQNMEMRWREEYEAERDNLSKAYDAKLKAEKDSADQLHDQKLQNELLKLSISLRREFADTVKNSVESERQGRLGKLEELSSGVEELEKLTGDWTSVVDSTIDTQRLLVAVEAVRAALESSDRPKPFISELAALKEVGSENDVVGAAIASISPLAYQRGIPAQGQLVDRFRRVASEVRKAALLPDNAGVASHAASLVLSRFMFRKSGLPLGDDVESILTRAELLLEEGNLEDAVREVNSLTGWAKTLSRDWLAESRRVLEVQQALDVSIFLPATSRRLTSAGNSNGGTASKPACRINRFFLQ